MNITSAPFLFLFLPAVIVVYYLIPAKKDLHLRNVFLVIASLAFYVWGEPVFIVLLLLMIFLTWCFGKMALQKNRARGKMAIFLTVFINLVVILLFGKQELLLPFLGELFHRDLSSFKADLPVGFSFFVFSSISYVVDIYRGQCKEPNSFWDTVLYTSAFFRILEGPIISYRKFETQIQTRPQGFNLIGNGLWRFSLGLIKKILIADQLSTVVDAVLSLDLSSLPIGDAWLGCVSFLVYLYFDFSGYSDMAIGLAEIFGFSIPENFNDPYVSTSISEFWRRWHMTLYAWFTEYLYYPIMLGPSMKLRKFLQRHKVGPKIAQTLQQIFVAGTVWFVAALWHGLNWNFLLWGFLNCAGMIIETYIKPLKNKYLNRVLRCVGLLLFCCLTMPLISMDSINESFQYYKAMFGGSWALSDTMLSLVKCYGIYLLAGVLGCFPILKLVKKEFFLKTKEKYHVIWDVCGAIVLFALVLLSLSFVFTNTPIDFLYQQ